jgi:uncharacterized protein
MGKIVLLIVLVAIAIAWFRARANKVTDRKAPPPAQAAGAERMVSCAHCSVHLPASEAVFDAAGTPFCGQPHLEARRARGGTGK